MSIMDTIKHLFQNRRMKDVSARVDLVNRQTDEMRRQLNHLAEGDDPFSDFVRAVRDADIRRGQEK